MKKFSHSKLRINYDSEIHEVRFRVGVERERSLQVSKEELLFECITIIDYFNDRLVYFVLAGISFFYFFSIENLVRTVLGGLFFGQLSVLGHNVALERVLFYFLTFFESNFRELQPFRSGNDVFGVHSHHGATVDFFRSGYEQKSRVELVQQNDTFGLVVSFEQNKNCSRFETSTEFRNAGAVLLRYFAFVGFLEV